MKSSFLILLGLFGLIHSGLGHGDEDDVDDGNRLLRAKRYIVFDKSKPNLQYQTCQAARNQPGHCKHIAYCKVPTQRMRDVLEKLCIIENTYIGVCCPDDMGAFAADGANIVYNLPSTGDADAPQVHDQNAIIFKTAENRGCGLSTNTDTDSSSPPDWPWMAGIMVKGQEHAFCGSVVITEKHILTAAHCLKDYFDPDDIEVRLGEYNFETPGETRYRQIPVKNITNHPEFDKATYDNDIAIIELDRATSFNSYIWPICLPPVDVEVEGKDGIVVGWGTTEFSGPTADILQEITIPIWSETECKSAFTQPITERQFCAAGRNGGQDSCQGDSGGPLMFQLPNKRWVNLGVVSWGVRCGEKGRAGIYTKVNQYLEWITENTRLD